MSLIFTLCHCSEYWNYLAGLVRLLLQSHLLLRRFTDEAVEAGVCSQTKTGKKEIQSGRLPLKLDKANDNI